MPVLPHPKALTLAPDIGLTSVTVVIYQNDLLQQDVGGGLQDTVNRPKECGPGFIIKCYDNRSLGQIIIIVFLLSAPVNGM